MTLMSKGDNKNDEQMVVDKTIPFAHRLFISTFITRVYV